MTKFISLRNKYNSVKNTLSSHKQELSLNYFLQSHIRRMEFTFNEQHAKLVKFKCSKQI